jgi:hypothetical protein
MGLILTLVLNDKQNVMLTTAIFSIVLNVIVMSVAKQSVIVVNVVAPSMNTLFLKESFQQNYFKRSLQMLWQSA